MKRTTKLTYFAVIAVLAIVICIGIASSVDGKWFQNSDISTWSLKRTADGNADGKRYDICITSRNYTQCIEVNGPVSAKAEEEVTVSAQIKPEYAEELKIFGFTIYFGCADVPVNYISEFPYSDGNCTFTMPKTEELEWEAEVGNDSVIIIVNVYPSDWDM